MLATRTSSWTPVGVLFAVLFGVFLAAGYGLIALCFLILLVALLGGAVMSWIAPD